MAHRALVAYRRPTGGYDLRYSHRGGADPSLGTRLTPGTPLGRGVVDADALATAVPARRVLAAYLDPRTYEMLYLVSPAFEVTAYVVLSLEFAELVEGADRPRARGALVAVRPGTDVREHRTWLRATKAVLTDAVESGLLSRHAAKAYLHGRVHAELGGYTYTYEGAPR